MRPGENRSHSDTKNGDEQRFRRARVLVVEDQDDVRRLLVTALEIEGHDVDEASNAIEGLQKIRQTRYNLILTDYAMPGGTGTWMLKQASADGLLQGTVSLVVTAHPDARELSAHDVIPKPLDLDNFLEQVRRVLASGRNRDTPGTADDGRSRRSRFIVELVLYVSSASPASIQARRNLEQVLDRFEGSQIKYTVCDLGRDPMAGETDRVAFTPTLVKRYPEPRMWLLGNLRETDLIADILRVCGVDAKA
jgi:two-component system response regulator GlrR